MKRHLDALRITAGIAGMTGVMYAFAYLVAEISKTHPVIGASLFFGVIFGAVYTLSYKISERT